MGIQPVPAFFTTARHCLHIVTTLLLHSAPSVSPTIPFWLCKFAIHIARLDGFASSSLYLHELLMVWPMVLRRTHWLRVSCVATGSMLGCWCSCALLFFSLTASPSFLGRMMLITNSRHYRTQHARNRPTYRLCTILHSRVSHFLLGPWSLALPHATSIVWTELGMLT